MLEMSVAISWSLALDLLCGENVTWAFTSVKLFEKSASHTP